MTHAACRRFSVVSAALVALALAWPAGAAAQTVSRPGQQAAAQAVPQGRVDGNAEQTRQLLYDVLEKYPPSLATVLKLDPSLLTNPAYLAPYPALSAFLSEHPEIGRNPEYFFARISTGGYAIDARTRERHETYEMIGSYLAGFGAFVAFFSVLGIVVWLIRTVLEQRRWNRLSKIQAEVHTKLMDRFSSNDELLSYVQTPSGRRFLEAGPSPLPAEAPPAMAAPFSRILWSVQAGVVLTVAGIGMMLVSRRFVTDSEPAHFFFVIGMLTLALGAGFVVSAAAAFGLSRKLGLFARAAPDNA